MHHFKVLVVALVLTQQTALVCAQVQGSARPLSPLGGQLNGQGQNYVITNNIQIKGVTSLPAVDGLNREGNMQTVEYFDGLGRPLQTVGTQRSPLGNDIVQPFSYDAYGREDRKYLPIVMGAGDGRYKAGIVDASGDYTGSTVYNNGLTDAIVDDKKPYAVTRFETSPLNRRLKLGMPGEVWQPDDASGYSSPVDSDRSFQRAYEFNADNEVLMWTYTPPSAAYPLGLVEAGTASEPVYYPVNALTRTRTKDEHHNEIIEYLNKKGHTLLKRVQASGGSFSPTNANKDKNFASTYYVYDDFDNLVCVIPPEATTRLTTQYYHAEATYTTKEIFLARWAFRYTYDLRRRQTQRQMPGAKAIFIVYDNRDRVVMTQDGNQRADAQWLFTKYDALNRAVMTGIMRKSGLITQAEGQKNVNDFYATNSGGEALSESYVGAAGNVHGYSGKAYPGADVIQRYLTVTYYDRYEFKTLFGSSAFNYKDDELPENARDPDWGTSGNERVEGQITGTKVCLLTDATWLKTVNYYDKEYRLIQQIADNVKGYTIASNAYDFTGRMRWTKSILYGGQPVIWTHVSNAQVGSETLTGTAASSWTAGATSQQLLSAGTDGWSEVTVVKSGFMVGLGDQFISVHYNYIDYAFYADGSTLYIRENGTSRLSVGKVYPGDILRVERVGTTVYYKVNGVVVYTSAVASNTSLMSYVSFGANGAALDQGRLSNTFDMLSGNALLSAFTKRFTYDHAGHLKDTRLKAGHGNEIILSRNAYNELGQLMEKNLHKTNEQEGTPVSIDAQVGQPGVIYGETLALSSYQNEKAAVAKTMVRMLPGFRVPAGSKFSAHIGYSEADAAEYNNGLSFVQSIDYRYNIRGWISSINNAELTQDDANDVNRDFFGVNLDYDNNPFPQYNGNVSAIRWSRNLGLGKVKQLSYSYNYDVMNRFTGAQFKNQDASGWQTMPNSRFSETFVTYDLNGNIRTLNRNDGRETTDLMDKLEYNYGTDDGNQLAYVRDAGDVRKGFKEGNAGTNDYSYDSNGNMLTDRNKGITSDVVYNHHNLPVEVAKDSNRINYSYDAKGTKHAQVVSMSDQRLTTQYIGPWIFANNVLQFLQHEEGRITLSKRELVYKNTGADLASVTTTSGASVTGEILGKETYIKVTGATGTTSKTGLVTAGYEGAFIVNGGERYLFRVKGYYTASAYFLYVAANTGDLIWQGASLSSAATSEAWVENLIVVPSDVTQLVFGVYRHGGSGGNAYLNDIEVYKLGSDDPEYQYQLKDHLDNVRVTFTTKYITNQYTAGFEEPDRSREASNFENYPSGGAKISTIPANAQTGTTSLFLDGGYDGKVGIAKSFAVMPGDKVQVRAYAKYTVGPGQSTDYSDFVTALLTAFSLSPPATGEIGTASSAISAFGDWEIGDDGNSHEDDPVKAFVNIVLFDKDHKFLDATYAASTGSGELIIKSYTVTESGYAYVYLSNEHPTRLDVYFDDVTVTHTPSLVIQSNDYYPFGLTFNEWRRESVVPDRWKFQGQEHVEDLGLNWDSFKWRNHQPEIGRFFNIDPLSSTYVHNSPYAFSENHITSHIELEGREKVTNEMLFRATQSPKVQQHLQSANQSGANMMNFSGGFQAFGAGFKVEGPGGSSVGVSVQIMSVGANSNLGGDMTANATGIVMSGGADAPFLGGANGSLKVLNGEVNRSGDGTVTTDLDLLKTKTEVNLPGGEGYKPDETLSYTHKIVDEKGMKQSASINSNYVIGMKIVLGIFWGEFKVSLANAAEYTKEAGYTIGYTIGDLVDQAMRPQDTDIVPEEAKASGPNPITGGY